MDSTLCILNVANTVYLKNERTAFNDNITHFFYAFGPAAPHSSTSMQALIRWATCNEGMTRITNLSFLP